MASNSRCRVSILASLLAIAACSEGSGSRRTVDVGPEQSGRPGRDLDYYTDAVPRDLQPTLWDTLPPVPDAGPSSDGGPDAAPPFEPFPMTRDAARRVSRLILYGEACVEQFTGLEPDAGIWLVFHPTLLHVANVRTPGTERFPAMSLPPLRCESAVGDCDAFLRCIDWAPRARCPQGGLGDYGGYCLPGHRVLRCGSRGFGTTVNCAELGGRCDIPAEGEIDGSLHSTCQYGPCGYSEFGAEKCIGRNALGSCNGTYWTAESCEQLYGSNYVGTMGMGGASTTCHIVPTDLHPEGQTSCFGEEPCDSMTVGRGCVDDETLFQCSAFRMETLHCPTLLEGSRCLPDVGGNGAACGTGEEDCFGDENYDHHCEGETLRYCFAHHQERISCDELGLRCVEEPTARCRF